MATVALLRKCCEGLYRQITPALGIGGERRKELCAVERSTEANAEPRKARPRLSREGKGGNAQNKK